MLYLINYNKAMNTINISVAISGVTSDYEVSITERGKFIIGYVAALDIHFHGLVGSDIAARASNMIKATLLDS